MPGQRVAGSQPGPLAFQLTPLCIDARTPLSGGFLFFGIGA